MTSTRRDFNFGPFLLQSAPTGTNLQFKAKVPLTPEQQCLCDNLFHSKALVPIHALCVYFDYLNKQLSHQAHESSEQISLRPQTHLAETLKISLNEAQHKLEQLQVKCSALEQEVINLRREKQCNREIIVKIFKENEKHNLLIP